MGTKSSLKSRPRRKKYAESFFFSHNSFDIFHQITVFLEVWQRKILCCLIFYFKIIIEMSISGMVGM